MKFLLGFCFIIIFAWLAGSFKRSSSVIADNPVTFAKDTIDFTSQVQPILVKNCSPCHFTGGKMYERMPFDKDTTIFNHQAGILRRIKGEENTLIRSFVEQNSKE